MQDVFEKIVEKLEKLADEAYKSYCIGFNSDDRAEYDAYISAIEIVKQEAEKYKECYKDCGDCEAYNKEKYHCPKFCKVIKETVKEIEENHNGWISCRERLPEEYGDYLVAWKPLHMSAEDIIKKVGRAVPHFYEIVEYDPDDEALWIGSIEQAQGEYEIIAWQPLPQPYTNGE